MNKILLKKDNEVIDVKEDSVYDLINEDDINNEYVFNVEKSAKINIFDVSKDSNRKITINLNKEKSSVELNLSVISLGSSSYEVNINHNSKNTISSTNLHGLALKDNKIYFKNNGTVKHGCSNSVLDQDNKIIIMDDSDSKIEPNLFIDEYDVKASHGAYMGKFKDDEVFYLKTRGLTEEESYELLINGFLFGNFDDKENLIKIAKKYKGVK